MKNTFNFKLIGIGLIFLIDFNINTIDFLPDFIGLVLIYAGIGRTAYINENLSKAKKYINYFFVIALIKLIWNAVYLIAGTAGFESKSLVDNLILLLTTAFSFTELLLSMFIFVNIFKGLDIFFQTGDKKSIVHEKKSGFVLLLLKIFFILKFTIAIISQIPELLTEINLDNLSVMFNVYLTSDFIKTMLIPPCFIIQSLLGIFILSVVIPFLYDVAKDKDLCGFIKSKINVELINDNFFALKYNLSSAFMLFMTGCVFFVDLQIDNINILPDFIICIIFLTGITSILKTNPDIKNKRLSFYLVLNIFVSVFAYITGTLYRITYAVTFTGENIIYLTILKISSSVSYHASVIIFFLIFIEFYSFVRNLQNKHLEFSVRYFNKYLTASEKDFDKNKSIILKIATAAFCVKTISAVLPQSGIVLFYHSLILIAFAAFVIKGLYSARNAIYSYYN